MSEPQWALYEPAEERYWLGEANELRESRLSLLDHDERAALLEPVANRAERAALLGSAIARYHLKGTAEASEQDWWKSYAGEAAFDPEPSLELERVVLAEQGDFLDEMSRRHSAAGRLAAALPWLERFHLREREAVALQVARREVMDARYEQRMEEERRAERRKSSSPGLGAESARTRLRLEGGMA